VSKEIFSSTAVRKLAIFVCSGRDGKGIFNVLNSFVVKLA
jgi:phage/plasmid-associated DNA primase